MFIFKKWLLRWSEYRKFKKEEVLNKKLCLIVKRLSKKAQKLQVKKFDISYTISRDYKSYFITYAASVIFDSTKDELIAEMFGSKKYKIRQDEYGRVIYFRRNAELIFEVIKC